MRPLSRLLPALLLCASLAAASCNWNPFASDDCTLGDFCHVRVEVAVSADQLVPGDTVVVTVTTTNPTDRTLHVAAGGCDLLFGVEAADGEQVGPGWICAAALWERDLAPGETLSRSFEWTGERYDAGLRAHVPLPAGTYRVRGYFGSVPSRRVAVTVLPASD